MRLSTRDDERLETVTLSELTQSEVAEFICDLLIGVESMARRKNLPVLARLVQIAAQEASSNV